MIFVTGGTGLVGSHLLFELTKNGNQVKALKRKKSDISFVKKIFHYYTNNVNELLSQIDWIEGDLLDYRSLYKAIKNINQVYHTAAYVSFNSKDKILLNNINIQGTGNLVNACLENNVKKLCHVSSTAALTPTSNNGEILEDIILSPSKYNSNYANSKCKGEMEVWRGIAEGLNAVIINPSIILGPGNWNKGSSGIFGTIYNGMKFYTNGITGYVDIRDVIKSSIQLMNSNISAERFIVSSENLSYKDVFSMIAFHLQKKPPVIYASPFIIKTAYIMDKIKSFITQSQPKITKEITRASQNKVYFSNEKIKNRLNIQFIPIKQSIKDISKIFLEEINK